MSSFLNRWRVRKIRSFLGEPSESTQPLGPLHNSRMLLEQPETIIGQNFTTYSEISPPIAMPPVGSISPHSQCLKYRIARVSIEPRLELGEQLARDRRDVLDARHRQQQTLGPRVECDL
jgi:hypothetical protein